MSNWRRPGESVREATERRSAAYYAEYERVKEEARRFVGPHRPIRPFLPLSVGTFDCNGIGKGSGW